jgi:hypothetical protein
MAGFVASFTRPSKSGQSAAFVMAHRHRNKQSRNHRPSGKIHHQHYSIARMLIHVEANPTSPLPTQWKDLATQATESGFLTTTEEGYFAVTEEGQKVVRAVRRKYAI